MTHLNLNELSQDEERLIMAAMSEDLKSSAVQMAHLRRKNFEGLLHHEEVAFLDRLHYLQLAKVLLET
jgi:hypothetical protein